MARRAAKVDTTHGEIKNALRAAGVVVFDTSSCARGYPDLHCAYRGGFTALVECKTGKRGLRESQRDFKRDWPGVVIVASSGEEAVREFFAARALHETGRAIAGLKEPPAVRVVKGPLHK